MKKRQGASAVFGAVAGMVLLAGVMPAEAAPPTPAEQASAAAGIVGNLQQQADAASRGRDQRQTPEAQVVDESAAPASSAPQVSFDVANFRLEAPEMNLDKAALTEILQRGMGQGKSMVTLNATLDELTRYARTHGYPASAAYIPAQESKDGVVLIKVIPGRIGAVKLENHSRLKDSVAQSFIAGLKKGDILETKKLETALYTLSDASSTKAVGVLAPGKDFGETELTVRIEDGKGESTILYAENYGSRATGRYRYGLQHSRYDVGGTGAKFKVGTLISNHDTHNYYVNYEMLVGHGGTTLGLGYSHMDYDLGAPFKSLKASGRADTVSLFGQRPLFHESAKSLTLTYGLDYRKLVDDMDAYRNADSDKHSYAAHVGVKGTARSKGLVTEYMANLKTGRLALDSSFARQLNDLGGHTEGRFTKAEASVKAVQALGHRTDVMATLSGQVASRNLDGSEDFSLGGANGVRAYPQGEASGDTGYLGSVEFRYYTNLPGLVLSTYYDMGHVNYYRDARSGDGGAMLKGYGFGISYTKPDDWFARFDYARRIGDLSRDAKDKGRMWFILGKIW